MVSFKRNFSRNDLSPMPEEGNNVRSDRVIVCTNVLPVILERNKETGKWSAEFDRDTSLFEDGPLYTGLRGLPNEVLHVGVPNTFVPEDEKDDVEALLLDMNCYPVYCDPKRAHNHFQGYCKGILWPTFHNVIDMYSRVEPELTLGSTKKEDEYDDDNKETNWQPVRSWSPMEAEACWPDHCAMNGLFAQKIVEFYDSGDTIWIHDYHLLLLPNYLMRKLTNAKIGLFLHVPFPSSEIFRTLASREEILRAMLCADHIGFDLYEYARHFLTSCSRMLGLTYEARRGGVLVVNNQGREVYITCVHIGLDAQLVSQKLASAEVQHVANKIRMELAIQSNSSQIADKAAGIHIPSQEVNGLNPRKNSSGNNTNRRKQLIVSIDEVEGLRGLGLKLLAFDRLLTDYAHLRNRVILKQIGLKLDSRPNDYTECHNEVIRLVGYICKKWGPVVEYEERTKMSLAERLALFQNADVFVGTSIRVGVDMLPFEYLLSRQSHPGCIVMSEFAACSRVLHGTLRVNPFKTASTAAAMEEALTMSTAERAARCSRDLEFIEENTLLEWANRILHDINDAHTDVSKPLAKFGGGFGTKVIPYNVNSNIQQKELSDLEVAEAYKPCRRRLIVIDYSGTLVETSSMNVYLKSGGGARVWHYESEGSRRSGGCLETRDPISDTARTALIDLCRDKHNTVVVISSDLRDELDHALAGIPNLALIAENGFVFRTGPNEPWISAIDQDSTGGGDWYGGNSKRMYQSADSDSVNDSETPSLPDDEMMPDPQDGLVEWQENTLRLMRSYSLRTNAAFVWRSPSAVSFNYILSDPQFGILQASNLALELEQELALLPLTVEQGKGFVTVRLRGVNRGAAVRELISYLNEEKGLPEVDFVACFGDDNEDESAFSATNKYGRHKEKNGEPLHVFSVRVGELAVSKAKYTLHDPSNVIETLTALVQSTLSNKVRRSFSLGDFNNGDPSNVLGNFKTKQSFVSLNTQAVDMEQDAPQKPLTPSASYVVANDKEMEELFGGMPPTMSASVAAPKDFLHAQDSDPRAIPPTSDNRSIPPQASDPRAIPPSASSRNINPSDDDTGDEFSDSEQHNKHRYRRASSTNSSTDSFHAALMGKSKHQVKHTALPPLPREKSQPQRDNHESRNLVLAALAGATASFILARMVR
mmetsp:Transcript_35888/g.57253  ORF Transcript_35888/g.57253 Transcript_35888/m.57253 type:complete len:1160 (+) Transcript_35888:276-3755(+)|eukprot:CAMPEP_0203756512 /NCGR_PEP_ID=MMETSP0098-20131031/9781_1 /ASSEMBLY_ACC=CAM_ASM_000208 /TAXON_ID=96639 /ORGANISM=" , Strain NY0313808BC1" /LENGTH=1159 /DNA_ID=CAMNT_0050648429 /DNA_START=258 /DNA_END=3737 /DNA_ORIENTATION=+